MIFGNMMHEKSYAALPTAIKACFQYMQDHDLSAREKGSYPIDGERFYVNIVEYETVAREERFWEAHKAYLDVHIMLDGQERIDLNFIENMTEKLYEPKDDFLPLEGQVQATVDLLHRGDFLICYPEDGHRTAVIARQKSKIKKAIFKVRIEE